MSSVLVIVLIVNEFVVDVDVDGIALSGISGSRVHTIGFTVSSGAINGLVSMIASDSVSDRSSFNSIFGWEKFVNCCNLIKLIALSVFFFFYVLHLIDHLQTLTDSLTILWHFT